MEFRSPRHGPGKRKFLLNEGEKTKVNIHTRIRAPERVSPKRLGMRVHTSLITPKDRRKRKTKKRKTLPTPLQPASSCVNTKVHVVTSLDETLPLNLRLVSFPRPSRPPPPLPSNVPKVKVLAQLEIPPQFRMVMALILAPPQNILR